MSKNKDTQLIWESYRTNLNEAQEFSMDKLVHMGEEQFNKMRGKADHDEIIQDIEKTYLEFFKHNYQQYSNAEQLVQYVEDGGFRDDLMSLLGLDGERENDMFEVWDDLLTKHEEVDPMAVHQEESPDADFSDTIYHVDLYNGRSQMLLMTPEIQEALDHYESQGNKKVGGATVWMGEEELFLKPNKHE